MRQWGEKNQGKDQGERRSSDSGRTQTITAHSDTHPNTNKPNHLTTTQKHPNLAESGGKTRGEKKVRKNDENCVEKLKKQPNFDPREGEARSTYFTNKPMILLLYKEAYFNTTDLFLIKCKFIKIKAKQKRNRTNGNWIGNILPNSKLKKLKQAN